MKIIVRTFAGFEEILSKEVFQITDIKPEVGKRAVYLVNLGSPDSTEVSDVRRYLDEFLMDKYVIDAPFLIRLMVVKCFVLPFRPKKSAEAYESIWWDEGSPLIVLSKRLLSHVQKNVTILLD